MKNNRIQAAVTTVLTTLSLSLASVPFSALMPLRLAPQAFADERPTLIEGVKNGAVEKESTPPTSDEPTESTGGAESADNTDPDNTRGEDSYDSAEPNLPVKAGDTLLGIRAGFGGYEGATLGYGLTAEHIVPDGLGANVTFVISPGTTAAVPTLFRIMAQATFHVDLLNASKLDTYASGGLGLDITSVSTSVLIAAALNARYFFDDQWAASASLGYGTGVFALGVDYRF